MKVENPFETQATKACFLKSISKVRFSSVSLYSGWLLWAEENSKLRFSCTMGMAIAAATLEDNMAQLIKTETVHHL